MENQPCTLQRYLRFKCRRSIPHPQFSILILKYENENRVVNYNLTMTKSLYKFRQNLPGIPIYARSSTTNASHASKRVLEGGYIPFKYPIKKAKKRKIMKRLTNR